MKIEHELRTATGRHNLSKKELFSFIIVIILTFVGLLCASYYTSVKHIEVQGISDVREIEKYFGANILFLSTDVITLNVKQNNPRVLEVIVTKRYPDTLLVVATQKHPAVVLRLADGYITLASDGYIIQKYKDNPEEAIPQINYYQPLFYNQYAIGTLFENDDIQTVTKATQCMADERIRVSSIDIASENMLVLHTENFDVFMTSEKDVHKQCAEIQYTNKELMKEGMKFSSIDVRFEKPIIKLL